MMRAIFNRFSQEFWDFIGFYAPIFVISVENLRFSNDWAAYKKAICARFSAQGKFLVGPFDVHFFLMGCCDCFGLGVKTFSRKAFRFEIVLRTVAVQRMRNMFFVLSREWDKDKFWVPIKNRIQTFRFSAPMLNHLATKTSELGTLRSYIRHRSYMLIGSAMSIASCNKSNYYRLRM